MGSFKDDLTFALGEVQRCVLGVRDDGKPRALYDVYLELNSKKKKKKKDKDGKTTQYKLYKDIKKKKKKKKKNKHWHI